MHLALELDAPDIGELTRLTRAAEEAGIALVTLADSPVTGTIEAGVRAAYLSRRTSRIGLAPTLHTTVTEPFHLATQLASLDHASLGRAGWVVGGENSAAAQATIGGQPLAEPELRREIEDVIDVARQLWDSWEDDAVIRDVTSGRFLDPDRVHHVAFTGERFSVAGPLITPRPPQGQLVVLGSDTLGMTSRLDVALIAAAGDELVARVAGARAEGVPLVFADLGADFDIDELPRFAELVDGVRLHPADPAAALPRLAAFAARLGPTRIGTTLRETLGRPRPANRFATAAAGSAAGAAVAPGKD